MTESKQHQRIVQRECKNLIKDGCPPEKIKISGIQNPGLENWAKRRGIIFDKTQEFDILHPEEFELSAERGRGQKMFILELRALLQERADYISYLEFSLTQKRFGFPEPPPYLLMPREFYIRRAKALEGR